MIRTGAVVGENTRAIKFRITRRRHIIALQRFEELSLAHWDQRLQLTAAKFGGRHEIHEN